MNTRWLGVQMGVLQEFGAAICCSLGWVPSYSGNAPHLRVLHKDGQKHYTMYFSFSSAIWGIFNRLITFWGMLTSFFKTFSYLSQLQNLFTKQDQTLFIRSHDLEVYLFCILHWWLNDNRAALGLSLHPSQQVSILFMCFLKIKHNYFSVSICPNFLLQSVCWCPIYCVPSSDFHTTSFKPLDKSL
jgi:hypothetical protein